jgi:glyoxylase-like metal-dependent hydrolase (beta-lactamase superfamily II)
MRRVTATIHQLDELVGGPTVLLTAEGIVVVDTGLPGSGEDILAAIDSLGHDRGALRHILITHSDPDHIGGLPALVAVTDAQVYAQAYEADVIAGRQPHRSGSMVEAPVPVDRVVVGDDVLPLHGGIRVIETFGHTPGHVSYLVEDGRVLLAGDSLNNVDGLAGSMPQYTADPDLAREAVKTLAGLEPDAICFGHGPPIVGGAAARLRALDELL